MSILQYPEEAMNASDLLIWKNPTFDNGDSEDLAAIRASWSPMIPILVNRSESLDTISSKENQIPVFVKSPVSINSPRPMKPLHPNVAIANSQENPMKFISKQTSVERTILKRSKEEVVRDEKKIDAEIEEIKKEISRLSSRLEVLRVEKAEENVKTLEKRGRVVPSKFMEQKRSVKNTEVMKNIEESLSLSARTKVQRRGMSLGPAEIISGARRGVSLGPSEIVEGVKSRGLGKQEITPVQPIMGRRKSCFWKLQDIDEEKVTKEMRERLNLSPKSLKNISRSQISRQTATSVGSKKAVKKKDGVINSIQPKKLFKDGEKSGPGKKPMKLGRVVASRYQSTVQSTGISSMRKRSLPDNDKDENKWGGDKKRSLSVGKSFVTLPEISKNMEVVVCRNMEVDDDSPPPSSTAVVRDILPRIRTTVKSINESPRDSGPAKRVSELIGRKSYFCYDEEVEPKICQSLSFAEEK